MNAVNLKDILTIKIKSRHDSYSDQFNRIFMTKMYLLASVLMGIDYFHDSVSCIVPSRSEMDSNFVHSACWIAGFYIYPELHEQVKKAGYYGIPKDLNHDGVDDKNKLCAVYDRYEDLNPHCRPFNKLYFLQYQWYPFYVGSLGLLHFMPYILFRMTSSDVISLRNSIKDGITSQEIIYTFFNDQINPKTVMRVRMVFSFLVKLAYIGVNLLAFYFMDASLNGNFIMYGIQWLRWSKLNNTAANDMYLREFPKPGNHLLSPMGICELHEGSRDIRSSIVNKHKFVCEISPNVLYQYVLIVLWWMMLFAIIVSSAGLIASLFRHCRLWVTFIFEGKETLSVYRSLTLRECTYLEYIRSKEMPLFAEVVKLLTIHRRNLSTDLQEVISKYDERGTNTNTILPGRHRNDIL